MLINFENKSFKISFSTFEGFHGERCDNKKCDKRCQGDCRQGVCVCAAGWYGGFCSIGGCEGEVGFVRVREKVLEVETVYKRRKKIGRRVNNI